MVERVTSLLGGRLRATLLAALLTMLVAWEAGAGAAPDLPHRADVFFISLVLIPATFLVAWLLLPAAREREMVFVAVAFVAAAVLFKLVGMGSAFNVAKLLALTLAGFALVKVFEILAPIVVLAVLIPGLDALSVWRGPTRAVVDNKPGLFDAVAVNFRVPGSEGGAALGPPDILFFALFLAAAAHFVLRPRLTWGAMAALLGLTLVLIDVFDVDGLPALPAVAIGFLLANNVLLWRQVQGETARLRAERAAAKHDRA